MIARDTKTKTTQKSTLSRLISYEGCFKQRMVIIKPLEHQTISKIVCIVKYRGWDVKEPLLLFNPRPALSSFVIKHLQLMYPEIALPESLSIVHFLLVKMVSVVVRVLGCCSLPCKISLFRCHVQNVGHIQSCPSTNLCSFDPLFSLTVPLPYL